MLNSKNFDAIKDAIQLAFVNVDSRLLNWLVLTQPKYYFQISKKHLIKTLYLALSMILFIYVLKASTI